MANKKRISLKESVQPAALFLYKVSKRSAVRRQWSDVQMKEAIESVLKDGLSQNQAADLHGVPRSTL